MGALSSGAGELRVEQVVRAQGDEAIGLDPPPSAQDLLDRRGEAVLADAVAHAAEEREGLDVGLEEGLLVWRSKAKQNEAPEWQRRTSKQ